MYTENAVHTAATMPFWIEGKDAIRTEYADLFHTYPMRRAVVQQPSIWVYNADSIAVTNSYLHIALVDRTDHAEHADLWCSKTQVKQGHQWHLVMSTCLDCRSLPSRADSRRHDQVYAPEAISRQMRWGIL